MLVNAIGNAPQAQLVTPSEETSSSPVLREKVFGLPVDREILYTDNRNEYRADIEKRQRKWIVKLSFLKPFLLSGERILRSLSGKESNALNGIRERRLPVSRLLGRGLHS